MNRIILLFTLLIFFELNVSAQQNILKPDISSTDKFKVVNRQATVIKDKSNTFFLHLDEKKGAGVAWLQNINFSTGIIEFDVKGKDVLQGSFVGLAFHGINDSMYEGVYFRPFNFLAKDTVRKKHAVQYISLPKYDWSYLRETYPDKYEHALINNVEPNKWFHVKIIVSKDKVETFVNNDAQASLIIQPITHNTSGKLGFWVGESSDGDFKNLIIKQ